MTVLNVPSWCMVKVHSTGHSGAMLLSEAVTHVSLSDGKVLLLFKSIFWNEPSGTQQNFYSRSLGQVTFIFTFNSQSPTSVIHKASPSSSLCQLHLSHWQRVHWQRHWQRVQTYQACRRKDHHCQSPNSSDAHAPCHDAMIMAEMHPHQMRARDTCTNDDPNPKACLHAIFIWHHVILHQACHIGQVSQQVQSHLAHDASTHLQLGSSRVAPVLTSDACRDHDCHQKRPRNMAHDYKDCSRPQSHFTSAQRRATLHAED